MPNYLALRKRNSALAFRKPKAARWVRVKYWEIIADNLSKSEWTWGCVLAVDSSGRTSFVADAHRDDGKRFVVHADEMLTAFLELEAAVEPFSASPFF